MVRAGLVTEYAENYIRPRQQSFRARSLAFSRQNSCFIGTTIQDYAQQTHRDS